jgi:hypothetical protein
MKKLNIPKGKWKLNIHEAIVDEHDYGIAQVYGIVNEAMWKDTAILIADAGTTYNEYQMLPSELLKQRNELLNTLKATILNIHLFENDTIGFHIYEAIENAIRNCEK